MTARPGVATVTTGTVIVYDGEVWTVSGIEAGRLLLAGARGRSLLADTAALLADPSTRLPGTGGGGEPAACGPLLDSLPAADRGELAVRVRHLREALTGYASGTPAAAGPGEPRPEYDPSLPLLDRYQAKAAELGVSRRTVQRWAAALQDSGPAGIADGRSQRGADPLGGVDERWLAMCRLVLAEHTGASRPTKELVLHRVSARLAAGHGEGTVPEPGRRRARAVLAELSRGTNAFTGSTKGKRSIAARPQGVYGRLRPTRPGEYLLLDTTPLDVFAMEPRHAAVGALRADDRDGPVLAGDHRAAALAGIDQVGRRGAGAVRGAAAGVTAAHQRRPAALRGPAGPGGRRGRDRRAGRGRGGDRRRGPREDLPVRSPAERVPAAGHLGPAGQAAHADRQGRGRKIFQDPFRGAAGGAARLQGPGRLQPRRPTPRAAPTSSPMSLSRWSASGSAASTTAGQTPGWPTRTCPAWTCPRRRCSPTGPARAGLLKIPAHPGMVFDFLPVAWRTIQHYGVEVGGLRYNGPALTRYRNKTSPYTGEHAGKWPVRYDTDDVSRAWFQDPADNAWHELAWEHAREVAVPFSADTLAYARRLALAEGRHVEGRRALAGLLERWDAGLVRHPAERRMAVRASQQRAARLGAGAGAGRGGRGPAVSRRRDRGARGARAVRPGGRRR